MESDLLKGISVHILEDDILSAEYLKLYLLEKDYEVTGISATAEEALLAIETTLPSIIIVDIVLPGKIDGIKAAKIINDRFNIPIIYLTAHQDKQFFERAKLTTPYAYLLKPFNEAELELTIDMALFRYNIIQRLKLASHAAEKVSMEKTNFITYLNHELRTPLNAILGFGHLIKSDKDILTPEHSEYIEEILVAGQHMMTLVNETLNLSHIESGIIDVRMEKISLSQIVLECLALIESQANTNKVQIDSHIPNNIDYIIVGDTTRVKEVLLNLLSNAVKYNRPNGLITLDCSAQVNGKLRVSITDTGIGIKQSESRKLFYPFERMNTGSNNIEGTGIGLVITRRLMEMMGGEIGYENNPKGGSIFWTEFQQP